MQSWPRNSYTIGGRGAGGDYPIVGSDYAASVAEGRPWLSKCAAGNMTQICLKDGPWTIKYYDICARVSGRFSTAALK